MKASGVPLSEHRVVVFGAGTAGIGIADQVRDAMVREVYLKKNHISVSGVLIVTG